MIKYILILIAVFLLLWAGNSDYHQAVDDDLHYKEMVEIGAWPDYKHLYDKDGE